MGDLILGLIAGILLGFAARGSVDINACEAELPRSESCILIAVPEKGE